MGIRSAPPIESREASELARSEGQAVAGMALDGTSGAGRHRVIAAILLASAPLIAYGLFLVTALETGPGLGDHEVIVAQIARQIVESGNWLVPKYLDTPFLVKPPLSPWLVAVFSCTFPSEAATGLPVLHSGQRVVT